MTQALIEHVNLTVGDSEATAARLCALFGWTVRWRGPSALGGGRTVHVGTQDQYVAVWSPDRAAPGPMRHAKAAPLNHLGVVVADLAATEAAVVAHGFKPFGHGDYEPGRRFYFFDADGIEFEVVSYAAQPAEAAR
jgi:catechol 2,3-dioxygenase-like lactoylglutathione lyase family enzyme